VLLRRQLDSDRVASSDFAGGQDNTHDTGLADEVILLVAAQNRRHQVGLVVVQLPARVSLSETQSCWQLISNRAMLLPYARGL